MTPTDRNHQNPLAISALIRQSLGAVMKVYGAALAEHDMQAEDLWLVFLLGDGPMAREELGQSLMFAVAEPKRVIEQGLSRGWIQCDGPDDDSHDNDFMVRMSESCKQIIEQLMPFAQDANQRWRRQLSEATPPELPLESFFGCLQGVFPEPPSQKAVSERSNRRSKPSKLSL